MASRFFNDVKVNLTLKPQSERANVSSSQEDLAVQMGKIQQWYSGLNNYATCATAAATAIKTVDCPGFELTTGTVVIVKFTVTNTAAVADLQMDVNETGAKHIKYRNANLSAASVLTANRIYAMLYDGTYWQIIGDLANSNTYDRTSIQTRIYAGEKGVFPYSLCALDTDQRMQAFTTTGGTGTSKAFNSSEKFLYPPVIMYHAANSTIANGSVIANNVLYEQYPSVDMRYNANVTSSSAYSQYKPLYIECTFDSNGYWSPTGIAQTFTSGKYYILLGCMYNTSIYQLALFAQHPLYYYDGTNLINGESHLQDGRYLPMAGGTMDDGAEITIPGESHSTKYTGYGMYHYIGTGNAWARGINVNSAADDTRIGSLGMYGSADATEPSYAFFGKAYNDAWYILYKDAFRIRDTENLGFQFQYRPASLSPSYIGSFLSLYSGSSYGYGIVLGHSHGGMTVVGGGESAKAICETFFDSSTTPYPSAFTYDSEELIMCSDYGIWFVSGAQNLKTTSHADWVDLTTALFDNTGNFRPSIDDKGSIGSASYRWNSIHGTTFYENGISLVNKYAAIDHTHSTLNVGNVGNSNTPVYFSNGAPTVVTLPVSGAWWSSEPHIDSSGVLEIGRYIDFHATNTSTNNYDMRFDATSTSMLTLASQAGSTTLRIAGTLPMLRFQQTTSGKAYDSSSLGIWCRPADTNGVNMFMQSGGCIMIGAGEFASSAYSRKDETGTTQTGYDDIVDSNAEKLYLGADGEVHIISNGQNIGTYTNNDHNVWKFKTDGMLVTPGSITNIGSGSYHTFIKQDTRSTSHCTTLVEWYTGGVRQETEFQPSISYHNLGGPTNNPGAIILLPYATDTNTWGGSVGLYIAKDVLKLDGVNVVRETGTMDFTGNIGISSRGRGYYLTDRTDFQYPLGYDNGANLWIGATQTTAQHHTGQTFISAGYNATDGEGNPTIYVAVPNATNTSATTYRVFHSGNLFYQVESNEDAWSSINIPTSSGSQIFAFHTGAASATPPFTAGIYSNGLVYGMLDTKGFISNAYNTPKVTFGGGLANSSNTAPSWHFSLSGTSEKNYDLDDMHLQSGYHYQPISTWSDTPWHKILSFNIDAAGKTRSIALLVYGSHTSVSGQIAGILFIRASTNSNKNFNSASIIWASPVRNITQSNFVLAYTNNGTTSTTFELYWKQDQQYTTLKFVQLSARALNGKDFEAITYYKDDTGTAPGIAAIPSTVTGTIASTSMSHYLEESSASDIGYYVNRTDTGVSCWFGVGSGGTNHGIYSSKLGSWMVYGTASDVLLRTKLYNPTTEANTLAISFYGAQPSTGVKALYNNNGLRYTTREGTTSQLGYGSLVLGNATASGTAGNKYGWLRLYSQGASCGDIITDTLTGTRKYTLPDRSGEIQVSVGQELIFDGSMTGTSAYFDVTIDDFFTKYRVILIEVLGLKYNSTEYCFKSVWPVKFIENLSSMGHHFLTIETTGNVANKLLITKNTNGFKLTTYSGGSFPTTATVRVYSLL